MSWVTLGAGRDWLAWRGVGEACLIARALSFTGTAVANPVLSTLDIRRILFQKITDKGDELKKAFQLLDPSQNLTVSRNELRRVITDFLMPLTREQFQDVLMQVRWAGGESTGASLAIAGTQRLGCSIRSIGG